MSEESPIVNFRILHNNIHGTGNLVTYVAIIVSVKKRCALLHFKLNTLVHNTGVAMTTFNTLLWQPLMFSITHQVC